MRIRLLLLTAIVAGGYGFGQTAKVERLTPDPATMKNMLDLYQKLGLPLPPDDAELVRVPTGMYTEADGGHSVPENALGFWLNHGAAKEAPRVLIGPDVFVLDGGDRSKRPQRIDPEKKLPKEVEVESRSLNFPLKIGLATAVQCQARGWESFAKQLAQLSLQSFGFGGGPNVVSSGGDWVDPRANQVSFDSGSDATATIQLAGMAWNHWLNELHRKDSDWKVIAANMERLLTEVPAVASEANREVLKSVEESLKPRQSAPGSVEALIDQLVDVRKASHRFFIEEPQSADLELAKLGFQAVPALIEHLDDKRMTRSVLQGFNNFKAVPQRVGDLVCDLLQEIAANEFGKDWLARRVGQRVSKADALEWWERAQKIGEEQYTVDHVMPGRSADDSPNETLLRIIELRYADRLPGIYQSAIRTAAQTGPFADAIGRSTLIRDVKIASLNRGLESSNRDHQHWALDELLKVDPERAMKELITRVETLPKKPRESLWTSPEARIAHLVAASNSAEAWKALLATAKRVDVGLRLELMKSAVTYSDDPREAEDAFRLAFLSEFLNDETTRDLKSNKKLYDGPCAGFTFDRISVRDFAAMEIAAMLEITEEPQPDWDARKWKQFRENVNAARKSR